MLNTSSTFEFTSRTLFIVMQVEMRNDAFESLLHIWPMLLSKINGPATSLGCSSFGSRPKGSLAQFRDILSVSTQVLPNPLQAVSVNEDRFSICVAGPDQR
jgi:hypothetical protein